MIRWLIAIAILVASVDACTIVSPMFTSGPDFRVVVEDEGRPVSGVVVQLANGMANRGRSVTNKDGVAYIRRMSPGRYRVNLAADLNSEFNSALVDVTAAGRSGIVVRLNWLDRKPIQTRSLRGYIRAPANLWDDLPRVVLEVKDRKTGRALRSIDFAASGEFDFGNIDAGIYLLRLYGPGSNFDGQALVEVTPNAPIAKLDLDMGETSCGWMFMDRSACPPADLGVTQLSGQVRDTSGAAIGRASLMLLDDAHRIVEMKTSDERGTLTKVQPAAGLYRLEIRSPGFTPLRANVTVSADGKSAPLEFTLGLMGGCGAVRQQ